MLFEEAGGRGQGREGKIINSLPALLNYPRLWLKGNILHIVSGERSQYCSVKTRDAMNRRQDERRLL
ncbi:hypothetical protein [Nostoc sp.]|uniref:hypothetical protein n=1 Tax=Nostoc sp. TaxID=1180 RepID=UPI002FF54A0D